ncbi:MAG TPA: MBL fold metallo-hydrolase [Candidatus Limnocylindria bacterium]|nr:MBL fold metallo-hydrolase [Candidatus Limnocylindria bacterium]
MSGDTPKAPYGGVRVVLAPNAGLMTGPGTNQYLLGEGGDAVLIDAAPLDDENRRRLATAGVQIHALYLTHVHPDHVGGAHAVRETFGVPLAVHQSRRDFPVGPGPLGAERSLEDGDELPYPGGRLRVLHAPGHESGHVCYYEPERRWLFTGDNVLSTGTAVIAPPDGDMRQYLATLERLDALDVAVIFPGHGPPIETPHEKLREYLAHRREREQQVLDALAAGLASIEAMVPRIYPDLHPGLFWAAAAQLRAHMDKLVAEGRVVDEGGQLRLR